jgi:MSHA biogenesis protein MshI
MHTMDSIKHLKEKLITFAQQTFQRRVQSKNASCCIEFGTNSFSAAYIRTDSGRPELQLLETVSCDVNKPLEALTEFVKKNGLEGVNCSWLLKSDKYQLITLDELPVKPEEFQAAVRWQIKKLLSFSVDDAFIDSFYIPPPVIPNPKKMITVVASQASYIQPIAEQIAESGLNLTTIDIQELALRNILAMFETDELSTALVFLQEKNSDIIFTRQHEFYYLRRLDWSFEKLANSYQNQDSVNQYLQKLALEVQRSFDYFQSQWRLPAPTHILMVSLNPKLLDIAAYMSQRLRFPIEDINLNKVLLSKIELTSNLESQYLSVIGGALRDEINNATRN